MQNEKYDYQSTHKAIQELIESQKELSVTKIASSQKDFIFLSPERAATYQPRATPWVNDSLIFSPERALHKKSDQIKNVTPFQDFYPGRCPGLVCCRPFRAKKNNIRLYGKRILFTGNFGYTQKKFKRKQINE